MVRDVDLWLQMVWSDGEGLGKDRTGRLVTRKSGKVIWKGLSECMSLRTCLSPRRLLIKNHPLQRGFQ